MRITKIVDSGMKSIIVGIDCCTKEWKISGSISED
jgi:hypothetical protein